MNKYHGIYVLFFVQIIVSINPWLSDLHGLLVLAFGIYFAFTGNKINVVYCITILASSEIFYRQNINFLLWEFPKYASIIITSIYLFNYNDRNKNYLNVLTFLPILCIPSILISLTYCNSFSQVKGMISPFLSGILALSILVKFFTNLSIDKIQLKKIMLVYLAGILPSVVFLSKKLVNISSIQFTTQSNYDFAGYGPIHVSTVLGFGIGLLIITNYIYKVWNIRYSLIIITFYLALLMLLTFSRSGLIVSSLSVLCGFIFAKNKSRALIPIIVSLVIVTYFLYPKLEEYTSGVFMERFSEITPKSRISYIQSDLRMWYENIFLGVGLGRSKYNRTEFEPFGSSHTEYSRFLAEQGILGLISIIIIIYSILFRISFSDNIENKSLIVYLLIWPLLYFFPAAFRIFLPAFSFGLAMSNFKLDR